MPEKMVDQKTSGKSIWFRCAYAEKCGACQLLKYPYHVQLRKKQERVESLLSSYGTVDPILGMKNPMHYRNKVHAVFALDRARRPISGVYAAGSHHVVPVRHCLIENEKADLIIESIVALLPSFPWSIYNEYTHRGLLRHVVIRASSATGQMMVTLVTTSLECPQLDRFVEQLTSMHPEITTIVINANPRMTSAVLGTNEKVLYGPGYIEDVLCGKRFRISSRSFFQVNSRQTEILYNTAIDLCCLTGNETILDAYCGTGTIGICASDRAKQVIGVEVNGKAVADAKVNAAINHVDNASFYTDDAGRFLSRLAEKNIHPDLVITDPPRSGCSDAFLDSLLCVNPPEILYISCNPDSLARDLHFLVSNGYRAEKIVPVDMFPGTNHVETVVSLSKGEISSKPVRVEFSLEGLDTSCLLNDATYQQIKDYVLEHTGLHVSTLCIAQVKAKHGIIERACYNKAKSEGGRVPKCPPEKEKAIEDALRHFQMIP